MRAAVAALWVVALPALAQEPSPEPSPTVENPSYFNRCFAYPAQLYVDPTPRAIISVGGPVEPRTGTGSHPAHGAAPVKSGGGGSGGGGGLGGGDGKGILLLAVVLVAALPIVVYAFDGEAEPLVEQRFFCPSFTFDGAAGVETSNQTPNITAMGTGRFTAAVGYLGGDVQFDMGVESPANLATHALFRILPRQHVEGALAIGYHRLVAGEVRQGFEVGLPHRYAFFRDGLKTVGLEVRPMIMVGSKGLDLGLEAAFVAPLTEFLHARVGGRIYTFGSTLLWGGSAGLSLSL